MNWNDWNLVRANSVMGEIVDSFLQNKPFEDRSLDVELDSGYVSLSIEVGPIKFFLCLLSNSHFPWQLSIKIVKFCH